jgi:hypothetical protein
VKPAIQLSRSLPVVPWHIVATVGLAAEREWEPAVLRLAFDEGGTTATRLAEHLLSGRKAVAERLLRACVGLGLLREDRGGTYELTEGGRSSVETGEILIPENGTWTLWFSPDPLLASPVLALEPYEEPTTADDQRRRKRNEAPRKVVSLPELVLGIEGQTLPVLHGRYPRVRFDALRPQAELGSLADTRLTITVEVTPEHTVASVRGALGKREINVRVAEPDLRYDEAWDALLSSAGILDHWDTEREVLRVLFDETTPAERASFRRDVAVQRPRIDKWGAFDDTVIRSVPVAPRTSADADAWARWRLLQAVQDTATSQRFAAWAQQAQEPFGTPVPTTPTRAELAGQLRSTARPDPIYWRLQAAEDWSL